jgi:hypothetical protein
MKITKALFFVMLLFHFNLNACDICNVFNGINPNDKKHFVGLVFRNRYLHGFLQNETRGIQYRHSGHLPELNPQSEIKELYNVYELRARYFFNDNIYLFISTPVVNNYRSINKVTQYDCWGLGDIMLLPHIQFLKPSNNEKIIHRLAFGIGLKIPSGFKNITYKGVRADLDMQASTGSWDGIARTEYQVLFLNKMGINTAVSAKFNTRGTEAYRYGHTFNENVNLFYKFSFKKQWVIMPNMGIYAEHAMKDAVNGILQNNTGGTVVFLSGGADIFWNEKFSFSALYQPALANYFHYTQIPVVNRFVCQLNYNF